MSVRTEGKQNITLALEKSLIRRVKVVAARRGTSVSALLQQQLRKLADEDATYDAAMKKAFDYLKQAPNLGGAAGLAREELHDRKTAREVLR
jgi:hypothetical protein